jgi:hypothetical protein
MLLVVKAETAFALLTRTPNFEPIIQVLDFMNELFQVSSKYLALAPWSSGSGGLNPNKS